MYTEIGWILLYTKRRMKQPQIIGCLDIFAQKPGNRVLTDTEIKVLEKGLDFAPIQKKLKEPELRSDFNEFCRRIRLK